MQISSETALQTDMIVRKEAPVDPMIRVYFR